MITDLYLKGFRGIAEGEISDFRQFNLLVGPNNSGKTTILEALYLAAMTDTPCELAARAGEYFPALVPADVDLLGLEPMGRMWQRHGELPRWNKDNPASWDERGFIKLFGLPAPLHDYEALQSKDTQTGFVKGDHLRTALCGITGELEMPPLVQTYFGEKCMPWDDRRFLFLWYPRFTYNLSGLGGWHVTGEIPRARQTLFYDVQVATAHLPAALIARGRKIASWYEHIEEHFSRTFDLQPQARIDFEVAPTDPNQRMGFAAVDGGMLPIDTWGDGARHAFKLLAPLAILAADAAQGQPGLFLWEEPELFMNPQSLGRLLRTVVEIVKDKPIQVFMSTQSLEVVAHITTLLQEQLLFSDDAMAFRLGLRAGELFSARFRYRNLLAWLENGKDPRVWESWDVPWQFRLGGTE